MWWGMWVDPRGWCIDASSPSTRNSVSISTGDSAKSRSIFMSHMFPHINRTMRGVDRIILVDNDRQGYYLMLFC